jgi:hypothetical protein
MRGKKEKCYGQRTQDQNHTMAMAGDPRDRGGAAHDEPGTRVRMASRACLHSAQHRRPLGDVLGALLLGAISLLPTTGGRHTPAGLCATGPSGPTRPSGA